MDVMSATTSTRSAARLGWIRPLSVRVMVLGILALGAFALLVPTGMRYLDQRAQLQNLRADAAEAKAANTELAANLDRWNDESYVVAQARERLSYVFPGETAYKVIDPDTVVDDTVPQTGKEVADGAVTFSINKSQTWYGTLWESVEVSDQEHAPKPESADGGNGTNTTEGPKSTTASATDATTDD